MNKGLVIVATLATLSTTAVAEEKNWGISLGAERATEAEVHSVYGAFSLGNITTTATVADTVAAQGEFSFSKLEVDIAQPLGDNVSLYMKNDFNSDIKHSETVIGAKISF